MVIKTSLLELGIIMSMKYHFFNSVINCNLNIKICLGQKPFKKVIKVFKNYVI